MYRPYAPSYNVIKYELQYLKYDQTSVEMTPIPDCPQSDINGGSTQQVESSILKNHRHNLPGTSGMNQV